MGSIYKGSFVNTQVDYSDNSPNEQTFYVTITDLGNIDLPYDLTFTATPIGGGQQTMTINWVGLPIDTTQLVIGYSLAGLDDYTNITINSPVPTGSYSWDVAVNNYDIKIEVVRSAGPSETYYIYYLEYELELADAPIVLQTIDNSEDKFKTVKSKSCSLRVFTNDDVNAMTFAGGGDTQYKVEIAVNAESDIIYTGWLSLSDLGQTFQPDPNVLELTATDGIAFLRDVPLSDQDGRFLTGPHPLIRYISWCLQKTGLQLDIWVQMNVLEENAIYDYPEYHFYNYISLDAQTFEQEIGVLENCYSVLEKILGEFCEISQQKNVWFIKSIDEAEYTDFRICKFDYEGNPDEYITETYVKQIGADSDLYTMAFMNDDARLSLQRPYESVEHNYNFDYAIEPITNMAFERGDLIDGSDPLEKTYKLDNWTMIQGVPGYYAAPASTQYINRVFDTNGYEKDRYVVITPKPYTGMSLNLQTYTQSEAFYVQELDKFSVSVDWRLENNIGTGGGNYNLMQVVLKGTDGSWWLLGVPTIGSTEYTWYDTSNWTVNTGKALISVDWDADLTEWQTVSWEAPPCPIDGKIYVWLYQFNQISNSPDDVDIWYANFNFSYTPYINGSYQKYSGQRHLSEQSIDTNATRVADVFISDSPKKELKGAMLRRLIDETLYSGNAEFSADNSITLNGFLMPYFNVNDYIRVINTTSNNKIFRIISVNYSVVLNNTVIGTEQDTIVESDASTTIQGFLYNLTSQFYDSIDYPGGGAPSSQIYPYGQHQNQAVWNQYNRVFSAFEATIDGLDTDKVDALGLPDLPDLMHCYQQMDAHPATTDKQFKVLHYEQDTDNCEWGLYMIEVGDTNIPKSYDGHSFKYIQK